MSATTIDQSIVSDWIGDYERLWRTPGTDGLSALFTSDVVYRVSPWRQAFHGLGALARFWESARDGANERFTLSRAVLAVQPPTAVARVHVDYDDGRSWRDLWVLQFAQDGRVHQFEEWPFAPDSPDGQDRAIAAGPGNPTTQPR